MRITHYPNLKLGWLALLLAALRRIDLAPSTGAIARPGLEPGSQGVLPLHYRAMCDIITAQQYTSRFRREQPWLFVTAGNNSRRLSHEYLEETVCIAAVPCHHDSIPWRVSLLAVMVGSHSRCAVRRSRNSFVGHSDSVR